MVDSPVTILIRRQEVGVIVGAKWQPVAVFAVENRRKQPWIVLSKIAARVPTPN
jgi:hypothetical protein